MEVHQKRQLLVFQGQHENLPWGTYNSSLKTNSSTLTLYDSKENKLVLSQSHEDDTAMRSVSSTIFHALNTSNGLNSIWLKSNYYEIPTKRCEIGIQVTFDDIFLETLFKLLQTPTISVQCKLTKTSDVALTLSIPLKAKSVQDIGSEFQTFQLSEYPQLDSSRISYTILLQEVNGNHKNQCNVLEKLFTDKTLADCCILTATKTEIRCHANILAANSDVFHTMLTTGLKESETKNIEMPDISDKAAKELVAYLYGRDIDSNKMKDDLAFELLRAAHKHNITSLEEHMMEALLFKPNEAFDINTVLALYFYTVNIEQFQNLCGKTLDVMRKNPKGLVAASAYQDLLAQYPKEGAILALKLLELGSN